jgi:hypothetical protein
MEVHGALGGRRLRSLPVLPPAGPLATAPEHVGTLLAAAADLARELSARALTVLTREPVAVAALGSLAPRPKTPAWALQLPADQSELHARWSQNVRRSVARAESGALVVREGRSDRDLRAFYRLYLSTMRRHSVLPRRLRQLRLARDLLPAEAFRLVLVERRGRAIAGAILHELHGTVSLLYMAGDLTHRDARPNHALLGHELRRAVEAGRSTFDFGRALPGSSLAWFKEQWGAEPVPEYHYEAAAIAERRLRAVDRLAVAHGRARGVDAAWARAPLALTRIAGNAAYRWL